jgi:uroporphyrinogen-III decarboxylase
VQIFNTWAGILPAREFEMWCIRPHARLIEKLRAEIPGARVIGFPCGAGTELGRYLAAVAVDTVVHKKLSKLRAALEAHHNKYSRSVLARQAIAA